MINFKYTFNNISNSNLITNSSLVSKKSNNHHHVLNAAASLSSLNQTNSSFSVLSNYSDSVNQAMSGTKSSSTVSNLSSKYPIKKSYINFGAPKSNGFYTQQQTVLFPKLRNSNNSLHYVNYASVPNPTVYHQSSPTMHNIFAKISNFSASKVLPDLYTKGHLIENKILGSGSRLNSKY